MDLLTRDPLLYEASNAKLEMAQDSLDATQGKLNLFKHSLPVKLGFIGLNILFPVGSAICLSVAFGMISRARRKNHLERRWRFWNSTLGYFGRMEHFLEQMRLNLVQRYEYIFHSLSKVYLRGYALGRSRRPYMDLRDSIVKKHKITPQ